MEKGDDKERSKQEIMLSPVSQLFVSPGFYCIIIITLGYKTRCNVSAIVEGIKNTWSKLPRFSSKVVIKNKKTGQAVWVPVTVRVEDHVIVPNLDHSNIDNPDEFIENYTSNLSNTPLDISKPLWEYHILNIKTSNAESLGIAKFHHSLGDGMSLMSLLLACSRKTSNLNELPTIATARKDVDSNTSLVTKFWFAIKVIFRTFIELFKCLLTLCFLRDSKTPILGTRGDEIRSRKVMHQIISFDDVKLVKNTMKMKVNDVLLGMTQAGISRYLSKKYEGDENEKKKILDKIRLRGTVAMNLRPLTKIEELADMMEKRSKCRWGNYFSIVLLPLWIKFEDDPLEYVRRAKATMDKKKISMEPFFLYGIIKFAMKIFGEKVVEAIVKRMFGQTTLTFSNVMGPVEDISLYGHPMSYVAASALLGPQALIIHYVSYVNKIIINIVVDTKVIPDPHLLCDDVVESLNIIKLAILKKGAHKLEV